MLNMAASSAWPCCCYRRWETTSERRGHRIACGTQQIFSGLPPGSKTRTCASVRLQNLRAFCVRWYFDPALNLSCAEVAPTESVQLVLAVLFLKLCFSGGEGAGWLTCAKAKTCVDLDFEYSFWKLRVKPTHQLKLTRPCFLMWRCSKCVCTWNLAGKSLRCLPFHTNATKQASHFARVTAMCQGALLFSSCSLTAS